MLIKEQPIMRIKFIGCKLKTLLKLNSFTYAFQGFSEKFKRLALQQSIWQNIKLGEALLRVIPLTS